VLSLQLNTLEGKEEELLVVIYDLRNYNLVNRQLLFGHSTFFLIYMISLCFGWGEVFRS